MVLTEPLTLLIFGSLKKGFKNFFRQLSSRRNCRQMMNCKKNLVYIGLEDIKNNGIFDWLKKREHAIDFALTCIAKKKLQSISFLACFTNGNKSLFFAVFHLPTISLTRVGQKFFLKNSVFKDYQKLKELVVLLIP